jgi:hypothetical protein
MIRLISKARTLHSSLKFQMQLPCAGEPDGNPASAEAIATTLLAPDRIHGVRPPTRNLPVRRHVRMGNGQQVSSKLAAQLFWNSASAWPLGHVSGVSNPSPDGRSFQNPHFIFIAQVLGFR